MNPRTSGTLDPAIGKVFLNPTTNECYGTIRIKESGTWFENLDGVKFPVLAEDGCGNYFTTNETGSILFWDHETDDSIVLADSVPDFLTHCVDPQTIKLPPHTVKSVWVNPAFAKSHGIKTPQDGWIRRPSKPKRNWLSRIAFWR